MFTKRLLAAVAAITLLVPPCCSRRNRRRRGQKTCGRDKDERRGGHKRDSAFRREFRRREIFGSARDERSQFRD